MRKKSMLNFSFDLGTHRLRVRSTTRTLIIVVTCYLWANILDVIVASWEYIDDDSLKSSPMFYTVATDVSSLLPVLACALRLPIYSANDAIIKNEIRVTCLRVLSCFLICSKKQKNVAAKKEFSIEMNHKVTDDVRIPNPDSQSFTSVLHQSQEEIDIYKLIKTRKNIAKQQ
uniref:G_PROTEIN_RECEP_F1_2 domain-containing protein n=1 Tax=Rhabditophanes sp. KR3021 TaxID=114890 RepID=A0AC35U6W9_9BILA